MTYVQTGTRRKRCIIYIIIYYSYRYETKTLYPISEQRDEKLSVKNSIAVLNDHLPVALLAQLVRALHRYRRGQGFESS